MTSLVDILAIGAHPDDVDFGAGAILLKMAAKGQKIAILDVTSGEMGTHGNAKIREKESLKAAEFLKADRLFLHLSDTKLGDTLEIRHELASWIRKLKPRLILAPDFQKEMNHPDHAALGLAVRAAARFARFSKILPDLKTHRVEGVLHYHYPTNRMPDFLFDVSAFAEKWVQLMKCFESQLKTLDYIDRNLKAASYFGSLVGVSYAQGLSKHNPILVEDLLEVSKGTLEI